MAYRIEFTEIARRDLRNLSKQALRTRIVKDIDEQLAHEPGVPTARRKRLDDVETDFHFEPPLWELRIDEHRALYDFDARIVYIRAIRHKGRKTTRETLRGRRR